MVELKRCPFCGSNKLKIESSSSQRRNHQRTYHGEWVLYRHYVMSVRCNCCHARGTTVSGDVVVMPKMAEFELDGYTTVENIENMAVEAWNERDENYDEGAFW